MKNFQTGSSFFFVPGYGFESKTKGKLTWLEKFQTKIKFNHNIHVPYLLIILPATFKDERFESSSTPPENNIK